MVKYSVLLCTLFLLLIPVVAPLTTPITQISTCGNQRLDVGEQCDPPGSYKCDGPIKYLCSSSCSWNIYGCHSLCGAACQTDAECAKYSVAAVMYCNKNTCKCEPNPTAYVCGNQRVEPGEECDPPGSSTCQGYQKYMCGTSCKLETKACSKECGAACESNADCGQNAAGVAAGGYCNMETCACENQPTQYPACPADCSCMSKNAASEKGCTNMCQDAPCGADATGEPLYCFSCGTPGQVICPQGCACLSKRDAEAKGYWSCGTDAICGYDQYQEPMYCFKPQEQATTCPQGCRCMTKHEAEKMGYGFCGSEVACSNDPTGEPMYCFKAIEQVTCPSGCECMRKEDAAAKAGTTDIEQFLCSTTPCNFYSSTTSVTSAEVPPSIPMYCFRIPETQGCPESCECMGKESAVQSGLVPCGATNVLRVCAKNEQGEEKYCFQKPPENYCGNGYCEYGEDESNCCIDCGCSNGLTCVDNQCMKPETFCESPAFCAPEAACREKGCTPVRGACRVVVPIYTKVNGVQELVSMPEIQLEDMVCCKCPVEPERPECEKEGGICVSGQIGCPQMFVESKFSCRSSSEKCCMRTEVPTTVSCESICKDKCTSTAECGGGKVVASDECNNGRGYSLPNTDPHCTEKDCCGWYVTTQVHDMGQIIKGDNILVVELASSFADGCQSTAIVSVSPDNEKWNEVARIQTISKQNADGSWMRQAEKLKISESFQYVKIKIDQCYNDYSKATVMSIGGECTTQFDQNCFRECMNGCAPNVPVECNFNSVCDKGEDYRYCCTDCKGCEDVRFSCDKQSGKCMPQAVSISGPEGTGDLAKAINRLADVLEKLIQLFTLVFGQKPTVQ